MTTARDVAAQLGLSVSTVGRALADDPRISAATKAQVTAAASAMGYVANRAARMMRGVPSDVVGVLVPDISNGFYATVAHALAEVLARAGHQMILGETGDDPRAELSHVRGFAAAQVAGAIIVPTARPLPETVRLLGATAHVQLLRSAASLGRQRFGIDDEGSLREATEHLLQLGHRRIAFVGGTTDLTTGAARLRGFRAAHADAGLPIADGLLRLGPPSSVQHGRTAVTTLLALAAPPTAVVTASVQSTRGVLEELPARGVAVPRELSVVGFGDEPGWSWWGPGLTTVSLPVQQLATASGLWLLDRIAVRRTTAARTGSVDRASQEAPFASTSSGVLTVRGSTGAVRR